MHFKELCRTAKVKSAGKSHFNFSSDHTTNHWFPYFTSWMSALGTSRNFLLGLSLFLAAPSSLSCSQDTEELTALSHKPIQSGLSCLVSELSLWYTLCYSCPSFSLLAQISRALIQTIYHLICFYFESYLAFPPIPLQLTPRPSGVRYTGCFRELWRLQWKLLMRALTAVLLQIQEAHLATQHGDPFSEGKRLHWKSQHKPWCVYTASPHA